MSKLPNHKIDLEVLVQESVEVVMRKPETQREQLLYRLRRLCEDGRIEVAERIFSRHFERHSKKPGFEWMDRMKKRTGDTDQPET